MIPTTIELCSGTASFTRVVREHSCSETRHVTIDSDASFQPTFVCDIMDWDYQDAVEPSTHFVTHIWASPPCTEYSNMRTRGGPRNLAGADAIVRRVLEIIRFYRRHNPSLVYFIENPRSGMLKDRPFMQQLTFHDVTYCSYGSDMRKYTRIWTNVSHFKPRVCVARNCHAAVHDPQTRRWRHRGTVSGSAWRWRNNREKRIAMGRVPRLLVSQLLGYTVA